ncbi:MAG: hypothetical protein R3F17_09335 [Planctomycetota bacterium]
MMVGVEAKVACCFARTMPFRPETLERIAKDCILVETTVDGAGDSPVYFVFPVDFVGRAVTRPS